jgi:hypothetical protein
VTAAREAPWRKPRGGAVPVCACCREYARQVATRYRPGVVVTDDTSTAAASPTAGGRE